MTKTQQEQETTFIAGMILGLNYAARGDNPGESFEKVNDITADRNSRFLGDIFYLYSIGDLTAVCPAPGDEMILKGIYTAYMNR